ncbi:hypothetical protein [Azospirillum sp. B2RO_4]|uniref:hypothetical protein n=1 Tax=Azospirillum sp. B2RO_4 TaxID=3027796 RepID=UPI003DA82757
MDQRIVHVQQGDAAKASLMDAHRFRHGVRSLPTCRQPVAAGAIFNGLLYKLIVSGRLYQIHWIRSLPAQKVEDAVGCKGMNFPTSLGMPISRMIT